MIKNRAKRYCIAAGCRNNDKNSNHSFFYIPTRQKDAERRRQWLTLLGREDLLEKSDFKKYSQAVCCAHFDASSIKIIKHLEDTAVPTMLLADQPNTPRSRVHPISPQFEDTANVLARSVEGGTSSATPAGSAQIEGQPIIKAEFTQTSGEAVQQTKIPDTSNVKRKLHEELRELDEKTMNTQNDLVKMKDEVQRTVSEIFKRYDFQSQVEEPGRNEWLRIIGRPDLVDRCDLKFQSHIVCSLHFDEDMVVMRPQLRPEARPTRHLPAPADLPDVTEACCQTDLSYLGNPRKKKKTQQTDTSQHQEIIIVKVESQISPPAVVRPAVTEERKVKSTGDEGGDSGFVVEVYGRGARR